MTRAVATVMRDGERDEVAVEEPLEIRVDGAALAVTMRTPGDDEELALGFLHGEGLIDAARPAGPTAELEANIVEVAGPLLREPGERSFYTTSSCGVCGKGALEEVLASAPPAAPGPAVERALLAALPGRLRQPGFDRTGGMHATGLFGADGEALLVREDVGRHNAMDKVIGRVDRHLLQRPLAADAARRRRVEAPRARIAQQRPAHVHDVRGEVPGRAGLVRAVDQPLAEQKAERQFLVVTGRAHRDRQRRAVDADLQRLLDGDLVALAVALHDRGHAAGGACTATSSSAPRPHTPHDDVV